MRRQPRGRWIALAMILGPGLGLVGPAWARQSASDPRQSFLTANGLLQRGLHELALGEYESFLSAAGSDDPDRPIAEYGRAVCLMRLSRPSDAEPILARLGARAGFEFRPDALLMLGHARLALDRSGEAVEALSVLAAEFPGHPAAVEGAGLRVEALHRAGRHAEAVEAAGELLEGARGDQAERVGFFRALSAAALGDHARAAAWLTDLQGPLRGSPLAPHAELALGRSLHAEGDLARAEAAYTSALSLGDAAVASRARLGIARIAFERGEVKKSAELLDAVRKDPAGVAVRGEATILRARVALEGAETKLALDLLAEAAAAAPEGLRDDAAYWRGKALLRGGDAAAAAEAFRSAAAEWPSSDLRPEMLHDRAVALSRAGDPAGAAEAFEVFVGAAPDHELVPAARLAQAALLHELGRFEESGRALAAAPAVEAAPLRAQAAFLRAENALRAGDAAAAEAAFAEFLRDFPEDARAGQARARIGVLLYERGDFAGAESALAGAAGPDALRLLGDILLRRGSHAEAAAALERFLSGGVAQEGADDALLKLGLARAGAGDHEAAAAAYRRIDAELPGSAAHERALFEFGQSLTALGRPEEAERVLMRVLGEYPASPLVGAAERQLAALASRRGDAEAAERLYAASAARGGEVGAAALIGRAHAQLALGRYDEASRTFDRAASEAGGDAAAARSARAGRAIALARAGRAGDALLLMQQLESNGDVELLDGGDRCSLLYEGARTLRDLGRAEESAEVFRVVAADAAATDELRAHARLSLASIEMDAGRFTEAAELLDAAGAGMSPDAGPALGEQISYRRGLCAHELGDHAGVVKALDDFQQRFPTSKVGKSAALLCAASCIELGRHARAVELVEPLAVASTPDGVAGPALLRLGEAQAALQRWEASEAAYAAFLERFGDGDPLWYLARFGVGMAREQRGEWAGAIEAYREVAERHAGPTAARAQFQVGECLFAQGDHAAAARELVRVDILFEESEWSAAALYEAGRCFEHLGQVGEAKQQYRAVVERFAGTGWAERAGGRLSALEGASPR